VWLDDEDLIFVPSTPFTQMRSAGRLSTSLANFVVEMRKALRRGRFAVRPNPTGVDSIRIAEGTPRVRRCDVVRNSLERVDRAVQQHFVEYGTGVESHAEKMGLIRLRPERPK